MARSLLHVLLAGLLVVATASCSAPGNGAEPDGTWLLISDYGAKRVQVLSTAGALDDLARGTPLNLSDRGPCGVAVGPGNRLYVADYDNSEIIVYGLAAALEGGSPAVVATITSNELSGPCGVAFDADGTLWVGDYHLEHVVAFRGLGSLAGDHDLEPDVLLTIAGPGVFAWSGIYHVLVDAQDRLWVLDYFNETISRIDAITTLNGNVLNRVPEMQIVETEATNPPAGGGYTLYDPASIAVDAAGRLYVGNWTEGYVTRFDGAGTAEGVIEPQGSAYLVVTGVEYPYLVALDAEGALWVGNEQTVARVMNPGSGTGVRTLVPTRSLTYTGSVDGYNDGGGMTFVPMPAGLGF